VWVGTTLPTSLRLRSMCQVILHTIRTRCPWDSLPLQLDGPFAQRHQWHALCAWVAAKLLCATCGESSLLAKLVLEPHNHPP
jgi:hypothetical protein